MAGAQTLQLVDGKGVFNAAGLEEFVKGIRLSECGLSYAVVAIMGPQSSGKSTLLNHLFGTRFVEMDAFKGRSQTTQGVWLARGAGIEPTTLVMDLEGTDGRERGEDDTAFEKQSSLFALAVSDIVLINMWCHDIGREQAANKPLLKTVFQVMMRLFTPRKTTLLFVIRDKTRTPIETLEPILREDIQKIWDTVPKPANHQHTPLSEFFNLQVTSLANYEEKEEQFMQQVGELRERFQNSIAPGGLAGDRRGAVPATGFPFSTQEIWRVIKENRDLDLPAHKVMVATVRCEEIAHEKLKGLVADEEWRALEARAKDDVVLGFGKSVNEVVEKYLNAYDVEAAFFDEGVRTSKRTFLMSNVLDVLQPSYASVIGHHRAKALSSFKASLDSGLDSNSGEGFASIVRRCSEAVLADFERGCADADVAHSGWDSTKAKEKLSRDVAAHAQTKRTEKLNQLVAKFENDLEASIGEPTASLLDAAAPDTWSAISQLMEQEVDDATSRLSDAIVGFEPSKEEEAKIRQHLSKYGRGVVEKKSKEEASQAIIRMKERFTSVFGHEADSMPRIWGEDHDVRAITRDARASSLKLLSVLAAVRLDEGTQKNNAIESSLKPLIGDGPETGLQRTLSRAVSTGNNTTLAKTQSSALHALSLSTWPGVAANDTLISPVQCKSIWRQFTAETEYTISQAMAAQEAAKRNKSWLPPPWAMMAMVVLGFNEFMALLRNPLYLVLIFILYLVGKALFVQLDISREFEHGVVPGLISVSTKLLPTVMNLLKKLAEEGQGVGSGTQNNTNRTNGTDRDRHREMDDMATGQSSVSNEPQANGNLRQRQPALAS
ncbi:hypothetical protein KC19_11G100400 [Ceratodon purpureus]|uniref:Protein ROOT HAIR DEFECTIVE 3 homolog n=1 Tax=Ceratodon purpureus TaxID=3225 RepID=A0A8T0GH07_CERPU|nr:hypothetical protein KC19_11G100400 [Ceratodon purpureus]